MSRDRVSFVRKDFHFLRIEQKKGLPCQFKCSDRQKNPEEEGKQRPPNRVKPVSAYSLCGPVADCALSNIRPFKMRASDPRKGTGRS
ncbi:hypothetical protein EVAR_2553_1 [Eumeta japonica]|uniref:Uncharacterized protein n=1 Tax=Eumeta variegata TaxID=151549 RepID=A0A4C1SS44_EUMVA|nr:hypothetical protein EVAR_2553_1 [Eumeta japonica]